MNIKFDAYHRSEPSEIYIANPSGEKICELNGIDVGSVDLELKLNDICSLSFTVDKDLEIDGNSVISNGYDLLHKFMRLYVTGIGWFIMEEPVIDNNGYTQTKSITASSVDCEFSQKDLTDFKINCGTTDSREMMADGNVEDIGGVEFAKQQITFYNPENPQLSLLDLVIEDGMEGWTVGYIDPIPKVYSRFEDGTQVTEAVCLGDQIGKFDEGSITRYSFLTQSAAQYFECVILFDIEKMTINAYYPEHLGEDTNIVLGFRNLQRSNSISTDDNFYTRYNVSGGEKLDIRFVNFGNNQLENIDHFLNLKFMKQELISKYNAWKNDVQSNRYRYIELTRLYNQNLSVISELYDRVPLDDCSTDWYKYTDEQLLKAKDTYQAQLKGYESFYIDENGEFDQAALDASVDANDYYQIKDVILPSIDIEITNRGLTATDDKKEYIDSYETNWKLYGIDELNVKLNMYKDKKKTLEDTGYAIPWTAVSGHDKDYHEKMYRQYLDALYQLDDTFLDSCICSFNSRKAKANVLEIKNREYSEQRQKILKLADKKTWQSDGAEPFSASELKVLNRFYNDTDYENENIIITSQDTTDTVIDEQLRLLELAAGDLAVYSQPQYIYTTDVENFLSMYEYEKYTRDLKLGNFIYLETEEESLVKLRVISLSFNPLTLSDENMTIEFSNMVRSRSKRDDFINILNLSGNMSKNSITTSYGSNKKEDDTYIQLTSGLLKKLLESAGLKEQVTNIATAQFGSLIGSFISLNKLEAAMIDAIDIEAENGFFQYLQSQLISADKIIAGSGEFKELLARVANINNAIIGTSSTETGIILHLTAGNVEIDEAVIKELIARKISVSDLLASVINTDDFTVQSQDGHLRIVGNTMQITDADGNIGIQLGYGENGKPSLIIRDASGNLLIDSAGVHEHALTDGIIKEQMVSDGAITSSKIDWSSARATVDKDGNPVWDSSSIQVDGTGLDLKFTTVTGQLSELQEKLETMADTQAVVMLSNEFQIIPTDAEGNHGDYINCNTEIAVYVGANDDSDNWSITASPSIGVTGSLDGRKYSVTGLSFDTGYVDFTLTKGAQTLIKRFSLTKLRMDDSLTSSPTVKIIPTTQIFKSTDSGAAFHPSSITLTPLLQNCSYLRWQYSVDGGLLWQDVDETTDEITVSSAHLLTIEKNTSLFTETVTTITFKICTTNLNVYDVVTIARLIDATDLRPEIEDIKTSMSGVEVKVDAVKKSITDKVWETDITNKINHYDTSAITTVRNRITQNETDIHGITSTVSDIETAVEKKADGTAVTSLSEKLSAAEQNIEGFKQTVSNTYTTKSDTAVLSEQLNTAITQSAEAIQLETSKTYGTKTELSALSVKIGGIETKVSDNKGKISTLEQHMDGFKTEVRRDYTTKSELHNLQIGGRNLVLKSAENIVSNNYLIQTYALSEDWMKGIKYTITLKGTKTAGSFGLWLNGGSISCGTLTETSTGSKIYTLTFTCTAAAVTLQKNISIYNLPETADHNSGIEWIKLEKGSKSTDWTPAPEDVSWEISSIKQTADTIEARVESNSGRLSTVEQKAESVITRVSDTEDDIADIVGNALPTIKNTIQGNRSELEVALSQIASRVTKTEGDVKSQSEMIQDSNGWKWELAKLGAYSEDGIPKNDNMTFNESGLTIFRSEDKGYKTVITGKEFSGYYDDGSGYKRVFGLDRDIVLAKRLLAENGCDFTTLKSVPIKYEMANKTIIGGLAFVKSGGSS